MQSSISYTLGANLETLVLQGVGDLNGTGNTLNNALRQRGQERWTAAPATMTSLAREATTPCWAVRATTG